MNVKGLSPAEVLVALYNNARVQGMGFLDPNNGKSITIQQAQAELDDAGESKYFDYLNGRVMKIAIKGDEIDTRLYNRDNGEGSAERAISKLLNSQTS